MQKTILSLSAIVVLLVAGCKGEEPPRYVTSVNITNSGPGTTEILSGGKYIVGTKLQILAKPDEGNKFVKWEIGPEKKIDRSNPLTYTIPDEEIKLVAFFEKLSVQLSASTGGTAVVLGEDYEDGYHVEVEAAPDPHYDFTGWSDGSKENPRRIKVSEDISLKAEFKRYPDSRLTDMLDAKIKIEGGGSYTWQLTKNTIYGHYDFEITPVNNKNWVYVQRQNENKEPIDHENTFKIERLTPATKGVDPITIKFSNNFRYIQGYDNVYLTTTIKDLIFPEQLVKNVEKSLELMKIYGFHLDDLKIILPTELRSLGLALGANTVLYNYVGAKERERRIRRLEPDFNYNWDLSFGTWIHEFFHIVDTRLGGIAHKDAWFNQHKAAKERQKKGKTYYSIPDTGCGGIENEGEIRYEVANPFEFFAVVMTARVNICKAADLCARSASKNCHFGHDFALGLPIVENEQQLKALLPEAYALATKVLEKGLPTPSK